MRAVVVAAVMPVDALAGQGAPASNACARCAAGAAAALYDSRLALPRPAIQPISMAISANPMAV